MSNMSDELDCWRYYKDKEENMRFSRSTVALASSLVALSLSTGVFAQVGNSPASGGERPVG